jgi:hypothetical protein
MIARFPSLGSTPALAGSSRPPDRSWMQASPSSAFPARDAVARKAPGRDACSMPSAIAWPLCGKKGACIVDANLRHTAATTASRRSRRGPGPRHA